jgi:hypothetical protein
MDGRAEVPVPPPVGSADSFWESANLPDLGDYEPQSHRTTRRCLVREASTVVSDEKKAQIIRGVHPEQKVHILRSTQNDKRRDQDEMFQFFGNPALASLLQALPHHPAAGSGRGSAHDSHFVKGIEPVVVDDQHRHADWNPPHLASGK